MSTKGGHRGTCKDTFNKCLHVGDNIDEVDARLLQGIIPDMVIDARDCDAGPFPTSNPLVGCKTLVEHKTLASLLVSVRACAQKVQLTFKSARKSSILGTPGQPSRKSFGRTVPTLSWLPGPLATSPATSKLLLISLRASGPCRQWRSETSTRLSLLRSIGALWCGVLDFLLLAAGLSISLIAGAMRCPTAPQCPTTSPTSILQLTSFFPTTRTVADTTACACPVLKHLAHFFFLLIVSLLY